LLIGKVGRRVYPRKAMYREQVGTVGQITDHRNTLLQILSDI